MCLCSNRKSKLIFFYELVVEAKWKGEHIGAHRCKGSCSRQLASGRCPLGKSSSGTSCNGKLHVPNLSEENDIDEIEVRAPCWPGRLWLPDPVATCAAQVEVSLTSDRDEAAHAVKEMVRMKMPALVQEQLRKWLKVCEAQAAALPRRKPDQPP